MSDTTHRPVLVVDFGAQYAQLIARRVREAGVYSEIVPHTISAAEVAEKNPVGLVLSGGPSSVYEPGAPSLDEGILALGIPTLGICYGFQVMAQQLGGRVAKTGNREYGATTVTLTGAESPIVAGQPAGQTVWMSHGDSVAEAPAGFDVLASTPDTPVAAFANAERGFYGVQWHPEVKHSDFGQRVLEGFLHDAAGIAADWNSGNVIAEQAGAAFVPRWERAGSSAGCPEAWIRRLPRPSCTRQWVTSWSACSWITACCAKTSDARWKRTMWRRPVSAW